MGKKPAPETPKPKIKVHCARTKLVPIEELVPNPRNPNQHPQKQVELLAKIIRAHGWRAPITVSKRSGFIVRGHGRYAAAQLLQCEKVPVDFQDYENEAAEWADVLADNKIASYAEMDFHKAALLLGELPADYLEFTAFQPEEIAPLLAAKWEPPEKGPMPEVPHDMKVYRATVDQAAAIDRAINKIKAEHGDQVSEGRALELICADFAA